MSDGHGHASASHADAGRLAIALALIVGFMAVEAIAGIAAHSLALLSDAAHMLTDAAAIGATLVAARVAERPAAGAMTFGYRRAEILSAQFNGATLLVLAVLIVYEGVRRLISPPAVAGVVVVAVAVAGVAVNLVATWTLSGANRESMNVEGAFRHIVTDLAGFGATAVAGAVILVTGFHRADGIASLVVAAIMLRAAHGLLRESGRVLLEAAPADADVDAIVQAIGVSRGVRQIDDLHVWQISSGFAALSAQVVVGMDVDCHDARRRLERMLAERFGIEHTTLQVDHERAAPA